MSPAATYTYQDIRYLQRKRLNFLISNLRASLNLVFQLSKRTNLTIRPSNQESGRRLISQVHHRQVGWLPFVVLDVRFVQNNRSHPDRLVNGVIKLRVRLTPYRPTKATCNLLVTALYPINSIGLFYFYYFSLRLTVLTFSGLSNNVSLSV